MVHPSFSQSSPHTLLRLRVDAHGFVRREAGPPVTRASRERAAWAGLRFLLYVVIFAIGATAGFGVWFVP